jgi:hypothetical protein
LFELKLLKIIDLSFCFCRFCLSNRPCGIFLLFSINCCFATQAESIDDVLKDQTKIFYFFALFSGVSKFSAGLTKNLRPFQQFALRLRLIAKMTAGDIEKR